LAKGHMQDGKFHPHTQYIRKNKSPRKKREPFDVKKDGVKIDQRKLVQMQRADVGRRKRYAHQMEMPIDMPVGEQMEWEQVVGSEIVKVKHEMMNGMPVTSVRFANGEEWFEFDEFDHQEKFMEDNNFHKMDEEVGEFVEVDHPKVAGFITMPSGNVLFAEREETRMKHDTSEIEKEVVKEFESTPHMTMEDEKFGEMVDREVEKRMRKKHLVEQEFSEGEERQIAKGLGICRHCGGDIENHKCTHCGRREIN